MGGNPPAEVIALQALAWIAGRDDVMAAFLGATGLAPADLRRRTDDPEVLAAVLDFLLTDDGWITAFCGDAGLPPDMPMRARAALPGGGGIHWT